MVLRRKWLLPLCATLFLLILIFSLVSTFTSRSHAAPAAKPVLLSGRLGARPAEYSTSNLILALSKGITRQQRLIIEAKVQAHEVRSLGMDNVFLVSVASGQVLTAIRVLRATPGVKYAEPDYTQTVAATPNDPNFAIQWGYHNTGQTVNGSAGTPGADEAATPAWDVTTGSSSIVIGETDTGVDYTHPDLVPNIWSNPGGIGGCAASTHGYNTLTGTCTPMDDDVVYGGHGTHVAGILGAAGNNGVGVTGVNWHTSILPIKWVTSNGVGATSDLITSLNWLLQAKKAGVNIRAVNDSTVFVGTAYSQALSDEIDLLGQNNILFVTAAGNTGDNNDDPSVRRYPCGYDRPTEICVAASDQNDNLPSWANYGAHTVDLAAPGNNVYSTLPHNTYGFINGSSMASPQVAGAAALILSVKDMTPAQLKADILNNVDQIPSMQGRLITGGRLNICRALPGCVPPVATPTPTPTPSPTPVPGSATFGLTSIGSNSDMMVPDRKRVTKAALPVAGNVYKLTMYLAPTGVSGQQVMQGVIYADSGGAPGALKGVTNAFTFVSSNAAGWYDLQFSSPISLPPGTYWIGVLSGASNHVAGFRWNSVSQSRAVNSNTYASGPSNPFGSATLDSEQMSIYASYTQGAAPTPTPTPSPTPSGPGQTSVTETTDSDFNQGTNSGTAVAGTGAAAVIQLAGSPSGPNSTQFKRVVTIDNTGNTNALSNYQVALTLDTASLISAGKMRSDCGDLRINDADDATALNNYWVESCNTSASLVWIKVPSIPASATRSLYLYYGNSAASSLSSISNTFIRDVPNVAADWTMNEASGLTTGDATGNGYTGSATSAVGIVAGKFGNARSFNGSQGYIQIANEASLPFGTSARTVCAWVTTSTLSGTSIIFGAGTTSTDQFFSLGRSGSSLAGFGWNADITAANFFSTGTWYDVCLSYDGTTATLYGNGVQLAQAAEPWNTVDSGGTFIGNDYANHVWNGNIDEVSYYTRVLSAAEISDLYHNYGYATASDKGHQLVRSYSAPDPVTTIGTEQGLYVSTGTWQSQALSLGKNLGWGDGATGSSTAFSAVLPNASASATIQLKIRTASSAAGLGSASYISLGTVSSTGTFTLTKAQLDALGVSTGSPEYVQVEVILNTSANSVTPQLDSFTISYETGS